jgi:hypothetical protein
MQVRYLTDYQFSSRSCLKHSSTEHLNECCLVGFKFQQPGLSPAIQLLRGFTVSVLALHFNYLSAKRAHAAWELRMEAVQATPTLDSYTPLDEHQSQTPETFFGGKPVLHLHCSDAKVLVSRQNIEQYSLLQSLRSSHEQSQGQDQESGQDIVIPGVQLWVSSKLVQLKFT